MEQKNILRNILEKLKTKKGIIISCTILLVLVFTAVILFNLLSGKNDESESNQEGYMQTEEGEIHNSSSVVITDEQEKTDKINQQSDVADDEKDDGQAEKLAKEKEEYKKTVDMYNEKIEIYNQEVKEYNDFFYQVSKYIDYEVTPKKEYRAKMALDYSKMNENGSDIQSVLQLVTEIEEMTEDNKNENSGLFSTILSGTIEDYNLLVVEYNKAVKKTSIDFIQDIPKQVIIKGQATVNPNMSEEDFLKALEENCEDIQTLGAYYTIVTQITNPSKDWVAERLRSIQSGNIRYVATVSEDHDPNGHLGEEGWYTACAYFSAKSIDFDSVKGHGIIEKGTAAGGAVEVYATLKDAEARCEYLSQFDGTLLWSGSYAIIGTMVVRTSYKLTDEEQIALTNEIVESLTEL